MSDEQVPAQAPNARHIPVMVDRVISLLAPAFDQAEPTLVDATMGLGGHSEALLRRFDRLRIVGIDRDANALDDARVRLTPFGDRITLVHAIYDQITDILSQLDVDTVAGVLMDLGVSSLQLDAPERGFAYSYDAPLDMRMDPQQELTAATVLNSYSTQDLTRVLWEYGEERFAARIARAVVKARETEPFVASERLVALIRTSIPHAVQRKGGHPAKRTFQALRIEVNAELTSLVAALPAAVDALALNGRIVVLSYQSLEDRLVKRCFAQYAADDVPPDFPVPGQGPQLRLVTRGAERPTDHELGVNPRAASARLRAAHRIRVAA